MFWIINAAVVLALAILMAGFMIPQILLISFRRKLFDEPDARKIHKLPVPRLGGIAFVPVITVTIALVLGAGELLGYHALDAQFTAQTRAVAFGFCSMMVIYIVGMADDLVGVRYRAKFVVQVMCALLLICGGLTVDNFHGVLGLTAIFKTSAWAFTVLLAVFIVNAVNLIDGIDGLASGLSSVAVLVYGIVFYIVGDYLYMLLATATLGVLVPFFYYNVFGNPQKQKKIFMGDTGSLSIGLILVILSFRMLNIPTSERLGNINLLVVAMSPLVIPCFDVVRVYLYRLRHKRNPFLPDQNHIHHKLLALGMGQRFAMISIVVASIAFTLGNILVSEWVDVNIVLLLDIAVWTFTMMGLPNLLRRRSNRRPMAAPSDSQRPTD